MVSHRRSAKERRAQRSRTEGRFIGRILRGCLELAVHRGAKAGDIISSLADNLRGRPLTKREHKETYQQTDRDSPVILVSAATQTEDPEPSVFESSVETGTTPCSAADDMQIEEPPPLWCPSAFRLRRSCSYRGLAVASTYDDDDDALLNAAITSVAQERSELANTVAHQVDQQQQEVHRVSLAALTSGSYRTRRH